MKNATCLVTSKHQRHEELLGSSAATSSFTFKLAANEATQPDQVAHVLSDKPRHRKGPHRTVAPASPAKQRPLEVAPNAMPPILVVFQHRQGDSVAGMLRDLTCGPGHGAWTSRSARRIGTSGRR